MAHGTAESCQAGTSRHGGSAGGGSSLSTRDRSSGAALFILADLAKLLILFGAYRGIRRFAELKQHYRLSDASLAGRLQELVNAGVLRSSQYSDHPPRSEYLLTDMGRDFWRTGVAVWDLGRRWSVDIGVDPVHTTCGRTSALAFGCTACGRHGFGWDELTPEWVVPEEDFVAEDRRPFARYRRAASAPPRATTEWGDLNVVLGDRWALATTACVMFGASRFVRLQRLMAIAPSQLSKRLTDLVECGVLERFDPRDGGAYQRYRLTSRGFDLFPLLSMNLAWTDRWFGEVDGPPVRARHSCGAWLQPDWWCRRCDEQLNWETVRLSDS